ncbi:ABC transporter substrate-binding protein [Rhodopseudomonas palustris]|uniref:ABC transporter substrate-binding protein n=1 Tax=Rhodopseudomonas palustris TaxID=1076 RepID=UPI0020CF20E6|nr:ABC transporter substrate-binding protein [Rhodopseudomonas palustris]MCP9630225.1 ABC transporter substrate-binding protein [Rhodopseudomonas palustris]
MRVYDLGGRTLRRRDILALIGGGVAAGALGLPALAQEPKKGGVLKVAAPANPSSLDPATGGAGSDHSILWTMYDTLVEWDYDTLKPKPGMAKWSYPDPNTMVLDINPGIQFHDGTAMDAEAVKFNLDRNRSDQRSNIKPDLASIDQVDVTGPLQVTLKLKNPDTALPAILSDRAGMMVSPTNLKALGNETDRKAVGAGPWKLVRWNDNEIIVVTRHENYWRKGRPYLDGIEFNIITENATALRSVVAGQNDMAFQLPARLKPVIERAKDLTMVSSPTLYCIQVYFNYARAPLDNLKVRQAINFAFDRDTFVKAALSGLGEPARMTLPSSHWAYNKDVANTYPHDIAKAKQLLAEAGYKDGIDLTIGGYTDQDSVRRGEVIQDQLGKAGIRVKFTRGTIAEISAQFFAQEKKFDLLVSAWTGRPDPSMTYGLGFDKGAYYNAGRTADPELSKLIQESRASEDLAKRAEVFAKIQRITVEQALSAPLAFQFELDALSSKVKGFKPNLLGKPKFENISLA